MSDDVIGRLTVANAVGRVGSVILTVATTYLVSTRLPGAEFARWALFFGLLGGVGLGDFGVGTVLETETARRFGVGDRRGCLRLWFQGALLSLCAAGVVGLLVRWLLAAGLIQSRLGSVVALPRFFELLLAVSNLAFLGENIGAGLQRQGAVAAFRIGLGLARLSLFAWLLARGADTESLFRVSAVLLGLYSLCLFLLWSRVHARMAPDSPVEPRYPRAPFGQAAVVHVGLVLGDFGVRLTLGVVAGASWVAVLELATRVCQAIRIAALTVFGITASRSALLAGAQKGREMARLVRRTWYSTVLAAVCVTIAVVGLAPAIWRLWFGVPRADLVIATVAVSLSTGSIVLTGPLTLISRGLGSWHVEAFANLLLGAGQIGAIWAGNRLFGAIGALFGYALVPVVLAWLVWHWYGWPGKWLGGRHVRRRVLSTAWRVAGLVLLAVAPSAAASALDGAGLPVSRWIGMLALVAGAAVSGIIFLKFVARFYVRNAELW